MVNGIGTNGTINSTYYQMYYEGWQKTRPDLPFMLYLQIMGVDSNEFKQKIDNYMKTGNSYQSDGNDGSAISGSRFVNGANGSNQQMFQSEDGEEYYDIDWSTGTYEFFRDKEKAAQKMGVDTEEYNVDVVKFGSGIANIIDTTYNAESLSDGQDNTKYNVNGAYSNIKYTLQEFDPCYLFDKSLQNPSDPEYQKAIQTWNTLVATAGQWMTEEDLERINALEVGSQEYKDALLEIILERLDQPGEYGDHDHLDYDSSLSEVNGSGTDSSSGAESTVYPRYNRTDVMMKSDISADYLAGKSRVGSRYNNDNESAVAETLNMAMADLNAAAQSLYTQLSANGTLTEKANENINTAVANTIQYMTENVHRYHADGGKYKVSDDRIGLGYRNGIKQKSKVRGTYNVKAIVDHFFNEFDSLTYQNKNA